MNLKEIIAYAKEQGFVFPSSEIYEGLQSVYDYGPYGCLLKNNIKELWWKSMTYINSNIVGIDSAIMMNSKTWKASGHIDSFHDIYIENRDSNKRYRVDVLLEQLIEKLKTQNKTQDAEDLSESFQKSMKEEDLKKLTQLVKNYEIKCEVSGTSDWTEAKKFNLMFETAIGSTGSINDINNKIYLRPETAQGIFVNFLNVQKTSRQNIPFGIAQIGKAFRNEIVARQFIFRMREFEQMEMQFFIPPGEEKKWFEHWKKSRYNWYLNLGIDKSCLNIHPHENLAHYANEAVDIEYEFPFGKKEIEGIHSRTDFDLGSHHKLSKKKLTYFDTKLNKSYTPFVIETSCGVDRLFLAFLSNFLEKKDDRVCLKIPTILAPYKVAIFPLVKKDGLKEIAESIHEKFKYKMQSTYEENQSIGKRYTRQDLIGTPFCITIDHRTKQDNTITLRYRDTKDQKRIKIDEAIKEIEENISMEDFLKKLG